MALLAAWMLLLVPGRPIVVRDHVDLMELNRVYNAQGEVTMFQVIFWNWSPREKRYEVVAFHVITEPQNTVLAAKTRRSRVFSYSWYSQQSGVFRVVTAKAFFESHTKYDPEMKDRAVWPLELRRGLRVPPWKVRVRK